MRLLRQFRKPWVLVWVHMLNWIFFALTLWMDIKDNVYKRKGVTGKEWHLELGSMSVYSFVGHACFVSV